MFIFVSFVCSFRFFLFFFFFYFYICLASDRYISNNWQQYGTSINKMLNDANLYCIFFLLSSPNAPKKKTKGIRASNSFPKTHLKRISVQFTQISMFQTHFRQSGCIGFRFPAIIIIINCCHSIFFEWDSKLSLRLSTIYTKCLQFTYLIRAFIIMCACECLISSWGFLKSKKFCMFCFLFKFIFRLNFKQRRRTLIFLAAKDFRPNANKWIKNIIT